jgi:hypothetical protein
MKLIILSSGRDTEEEPAQVILWLHWPDAWPELLPSMDGDTDSA